MNSPKLKQMIREVGDAAVVCGLTNFKSTSPLSEKVDFFKGIKGSRILNPNSFETFFNSYKNGTFRNMIGKLEYDFLNTSYLLIIPTKIDPAKPSMRELNDINLLVVNALANLWAVRDNSVNLESGFMFENTKSGMLAHNNFIRKSYYRADRKDDEPTEFNFGEFSKAANDAKKSLDFSLEDFHEKAGDPTFLGKTPYAGIGFSFGLITHDSNVIHYFVSRFILRRLKHFYRPVMRNCPIH